MSSRTCGSVSWWTMLGCVLAVASCGRGTSQPASAPAAVKVDAPVKESALTTITLTPEADKRLGIETSTIDARRCGAPNARGEVIAPGGAERTVTAPFAGTLEVGDGVRRRDERRTRRTDLPAGAARPVRARCQG